MGTGIYRSIAYPSRGDRSGLFVLQHNYWYADAQWGWHYWDTPGTYKKAWNNLMDTDGRYYWFYFDWYTGLMAKNSWILPSHPHNNSTATAYVNSLGRAVTGWNLLPNWSNNWYYFFSSSGNMQTGWVDGDMYYTRPENNVPATGPKGAMLTDWQLIGSSYYYFAPWPSGRMQTGWISWGNGWFYTRPAANVPSLGAKGTMVTGWQYIGGSWYNFTGGSSGRMKTNAVEPDGGGNCYLKTDGTAACNEWEYIVLWGQTRWIDAAYHISSRKMPLE
jgi:glucan-binding YG repeat protein